jgi:hypothetical protein
MTTAHDTIRSGGKCFTFFNRLMAGAVFACAVLAISAAPAMAQKRQQQQQQQQAAEPDEVELDQIELTADQIDAYIAAQTAIKPITARLKGNAQPTEKMLAQMEAIAKKAGFKDFDEFGNVESNIGFVFTGTDPQSKKFTEADVLISQEIAKVNADKNTPPAQKKRALQELQEALKSAPKLKYPANAELVAKNYDRLKPVME